MQYLIHAAPLAVTAIALLAAIAGSIARDLDAPADRWVTVEEYTAEHQGADEAYAEELAAIAAEVPAELAPPRGRHHEDTVEMVAADWQPAVGAKRIALLTDTQLDMPPVPA